MAALFQTAEPTHLGPCSGLRSRAPLCRAHRWRGVYSGLLCGLLASGLGLVCASALAVEHKAYASHHAGNCFFFFPLPRIPGRVWSSARVSPLPSQVRQWVEVRGNTVYILRGLGLLYILYAVQVPPGPRPQRYSPIWTDFTEGSHDSPCFIRKSLLW